MNAILYLATEEKEFLDIGKKALQYDLSFAVSTEGRYLSFPEDTGNTRVVLPYWQFGTVGVGTALLRYCIVTKRDDYLGKMNLMLGDAFRKYSVFAGLFKGLAGIGNFLLDCYQYSDNDVFKQSARRNIEGLSNFRIDRSSGLTFPGDNLYRISY